MMMFRAPEQESVEESENVDPEQEIKESFSGLITSYWKHKKRDKSALKTPTTVATTAKH